MTWLRRVIGMGNYYLAIDLGASSGRHILGTLKEDRIVLEEIFRFPNEMRLINDHLCWDTGYLFSKILAGLKKCKEQGKIPVSLGIDSWGVDFVLLDGQEQKLGETIAYRDRRTSGMDQEVSKVVSEEELYYATGIQKQIFNTIYQLKALQIQEKELLERAEYFLMIPDYFNFLLTGVKLNEYTNATTTGLVDAEARTWHRGLIERLGLKPSLFGELSLPKTSVGYLRPALAERVGFNCEVVLPPTHDTASAVLATPILEEGSVYISSGTWSLIGVERRAPDCSEASRRANFTNEGGYDYRFRYLKNIMGLWIIQRVKKELDDRYSFAELCALAAGEEPFPAVIDVNDQRFLSPANMIAAIREVCQETRQPIPATAGEIVSCVYHSLAQSYRNAVKELEALLGLELKTIHIVGGGAQADYLNALTAKYTGKRVLTGPVEATALGNILAQMLKAGEFTTLEEARRAVFNSFPIKVW